MNFCEFHYETKRRSQIAMKDGTQVVYAAVAIVNELHEWIESVERDMPQLHTEHEAGDVLFYISMLMHDCNIDPVELVDAIRGWVMAIEEDDPRFASLGELAEVSGHLDIGASINVLGRLCDAAKKIVRDQNGVAADPHRANLITCLADVFGILALRTIDMDRVGRLCLEKISNKVWDADLPKKWGG